MGMGMGMRGRSFVRSARQPGSCSREETRGKIHEVIGKGVAAGEDKCKFKRVDSLL